MTLICARQILGQTRTFKKTWSKNVILSRSISPLLIGDTSGTLSFFLCLPSFFPPLFSFPLLPSPLSFYLCVRFREIKTTCQVSDAPNLSWQKYALSHAAEHPDTTAEVDFSPDVGLPLRSQCRIKDARCTSGRTRSAKKDRNYYRIFMRLLASATLKIRLTLII